MPSRLLVATLFLLAVGGAVSPAAAAEEGTPGDTSSAPRASWYGYQTLSADATALALTIVAAQKDWDPALWGAIGAYLLGAPAVHAVHGRPLATLGSLGLRVGLPLLASAVGAASADCSTRVVNDENCDFGPSIVGLGVGMVLAVIIDSAALAWNRPPPPASDRPAARVEPWSVRLLAPAPIPVRGGAGLSVGGLF